MNFYFQAAQVLERLDKKQGSIKGIIGSLPVKDRKRTAALVIETLKCESVIVKQFNHPFKNLRTADKPVLIDTIEASTILREERKLSSLNLALVLVHDLLLCDGIQAGDGPIKQAVLRHKTRLKSEFQRIKIKQGARSVIELARSEDQRAGL
jgi:putative methyltransferase